MSKHDPPLEKPALISISSRNEHPLNSDGVLRRQLNKLLQSCKDPKKALAYAKVLELITQAISNLRNPHH